MAQPQVEAPPAPSVAAPAPSSAAAAPSTTAVPAWQGLLLARLQQFKRYPSFAQLRRQEGVVYLRFTMDRHVPGDPIQLVVPIQFFLKPGS
jgi:periplasmic protein TonB